MVTKPKSEKGKTTARSESGTAASRVSLKQASESKVKTIPKKRAPTPIVAAYELFLVAQIDALNHIGQFLGMFGTHTRTSGLDMKEVKARAIEPGGLANIEWALNLLLDDRPHPIQHAAAGMVLQYYWPRWREEGPPELIGRYIDRDCAAVHAWRDRVLERDGHACCRCGSTENLHAHHIVRWIDAPSLRTLDANGVTLCEPCHIAEHSK